MQNAEEFAKHIEWCLLTSSDMHHGNYPCAAKSIRARDREIVEACKDALYKGFKYGVQSEALRIIDSVLRDFG